MGKGGGNIPWLTEMSRIHGSYTLMYSSFCDCSNYTAPRKNMLDQYTPNDVPRVLIKRILMESGTERVFLSGMTMAVHTDIGRGDGMLDSH